MILIFVGSNFPINFDRLKNELLLIDLVFRILPRMNYLHIAHDVVLAFLPLHENIWLEFAIRVLVILLGRWLLRPLGNAYVIFLNSLELNSCDWLVVRAILYSGDALVELRFEGRLHLRVHFERRFLKNAVSIHIVAALQGMKPII